MDMKEKMPSTPVTPMSAPSLVAGFPPEAGSSRSAEDEPMAKEIEILTSEDEGNAPGADASSQATRESMAVMTVATDGPKSNTDANTKASETEMRASRLGILTVKEPVRSVKAANTTQSPQVGRSITFRSASTAMLDPARITALRYSRPYPERGMAFFISVGG